MPDIDTEADTEDYPADPCVIPPEAMQAESVPVIEGKRLSERCQCGHMWHQHWVSFGCQFCNCMKEQKE